MKSCPPEYLAPDKEIFLRGCAEFERHEKRDAMYRVATFLVEHFWGRPSDMADALGVLLLTWNQPLYRFGVFDFENLEKRIERNLAVLQHYRGREILSFTRENEAEVQRLFDEFSDALQISGGKLSGRRSPVATAKALHLLGPAFFPL